MELPWSDFLSHCDLNMPQVYWEQSHNPGYQLERSLNEFKTAIEPYRTYIPTGAAYCAGGWCPTVDDINEFMDKAVDLEMSGVNFWSWDYCRAKLPDIWNTIASYDWPSAPNPEKGTIDKLIDGLNKKDMGGIAELYTEDAIHINAMRTIQGRAAIRDYYNEFLHSDLSNDATFRPVSIEGDAQSKLLTWQIVINNSVTATYEDTIGLLNGQIIYHYSSLNT